MSEATAAGGKGGKADQIAAEATVAAFGFRAGGVVVGVVGMWALLALHSLPGVAVAGAAAFTAALLWRRAPAAAEPAGRANRGNDAEAEILAAIASHPDVAWIEQGRQLAPNRNRREDTDFVVGLNSGAIVVVEAKSAFGKLTIRDGVLYSATRAIHGRDLGDRGGSPMAQSFRGAGYVREALQVAGLASQFPYPVVCASKGILRETLKADDGQHRAWVCNASTLPGLLTQLAGLGSTIAVDDVKRARKAVRAAHHPR